MADFLAHRRLLDRMPHIASLSEFEELFEVVVERDRVEFSCMTEILQWKRRQGA